MSGTLSPHSVLSQIEDNKCNHLMAELAALTARREQLMADMKDASLRLEEISRLQHNHSQQSFMACELAELESAHREEILKKEYIRKQISELSESEKQLKEDIFACMNKSKAYKQVDAKEKNMQERLSSRSEQQAVDDLMAHRRMQEH